MPLTARFLVLASSQAGPQIVFVMLMPPVTLLRTPAVPRQLNRVPPLAPTSFMVQALILTVLVFWRDVKSMLILLNVLFSSRMLSTAALPSPSVSVVRMP